MDGALILGAGRRPRRNAGDVTLDADPAVLPDVVCTLGVDPLPFPDDSVPRATAIHVLEHIGRQGETAAWFFFWEELYRVLVPGGLLYFEAPLASSVWAWADPSHTRALSPQALSFLSQDSYRHADSSISPYRIRCDFGLALGFHRTADVNAEVREVEEFSHFSGCLIATKPLRPWWSD